MVLVLLSVVRSGGVGMRVLSLSGGKDSVASYFLCRHEIDCIIYVDSGVDFPAIKKTALMIGSDFVSRGGRFEVLSFDFFGGFCRWGWPSCRCRRCIVTGKQIGRAHV